MGPTRVVDKTPRPTKGDKTPRPTYVKPPKTPRPTEWSPPKTPRPTQPPKTPRPTKPHTVDPTRPPKTPRPTNYVEKTPKPTNPPKTPRPTKPMTVDPTKPPKTPRPTKLVTPRPTAPPKTPKPTVWSPPKTPRPTTPPKTPRPTNPPKTPKPTTYLRETTTYLRETTTYIRDEPTTTYLRMPMSGCASNIVKNDCKSNEACVWKYGYPPMAFSEDSDYQLQVEENFFAVNGSVIEMINNMDSNMMMVFGVLFVAVLIYAFRQYSKKEDKKVVVAAESNKAYGSMVEMPVDSN